MGNDPLRAALKIWGDRFVQRRDLRNLHRHGRWHNPGLTGSPLADERPMAETMPFDMKGKCRTTPQRATGGVCLKIPGGVESLPVRVEHRHQSWSGSTKRPSIQVAFFKVSG